jgi:hypothetical protein
MRKRNIMHKSTKAELQAENAELRERIKLLEAVVQRLVAPAAPQFYTLPCPGPHYAPAPAIVPYIAPVNPPGWPPYATIIVCGGLQRPREDVQFTYNDAARAPDPFFGTLTSLQIPPLHAGNAGCAPMMLGNVWVGESRGDLGTH